MQRAKKAVQAQLRAQGRKLHDFSAREITLMAEAELERNRDRLIAEAKQSIETWPGFARYRLGANLESDAQRSGHCSSNEIVVQNSGAEWRGQ